MIHQDTLSFVILTSMDQPEANLIARTLFLLKLFYPQIVCPHNQVC